MPPHLKNLSKGKWGTSVLQSKDLEALILCDNSGIGLEENADTVLGY